jgi:hypothetical protein
MNQLSLVQARNGFCKDIIVAAPWRLLADSVRASAIRSLYRMDTHGEPLSL